MKSFILDLRVLLDLISSIPRSLEVSLTLIIIYIKKNKYKNKWDSI